MLPPRHRMRRREDFVQTSRRGRRAAGATLVVHVLPTPGSDRPPLVGFVVGRAVGGSVVRHRVARRLRAVTATRLNRFAPGTRVVVRALPPAAGAASADLGADLDRALDRATGPTRS